MDSTDANAPTIPSQKPPMSARMQLVFVSGVFILLLAIVSWSMGVASNRRAQAVNQKAFDALSEALVPMLLERNPSRLKSRITLIAQAGGYAEITVADPKGYVLASTTTTQSNQQITIANPPPSSTTVVSEGNSNIYDRAISLPGDNVLGVLRVTIRD